MALLFVVLVLPYLIFIAQADTRCGTTWSDANTKSSNTKCTTNANCPSGQYCFADCTTCSTSTPPPPPPTTGASGSTIKSLTLKDLQSFMGRPTGSDLSGWVDAMNLAASRYGLNTIKRWIAFCSQIRHETASMTVFWQSRDNGGGLVHLIPSNWKAACLAVPEIAQAFGARYAGCGSCGCIDAMAANPLGATATDAARNIFNQPKVAALSAGWWFDSGAIGAFGWKGCNQKLRVYADQGKGNMGGGDCTHSGDYQLTCCIFWTCNEGSGSGLSQRLNYYDQAVAYAKTAWGYAGSEVAEEITQHRMNPGVNAAIAIGCVVGIIALIVVIVAIYLKRRARLQAEVV